LNKNKAFQPIRAEGPNGHLFTKKRTPTMGGIAASKCILLSGLLFCDLKNIYVIGVLIIVCVFSLIGFIDDYIKVFHKNTNGFKGSIKLILQVIVSGSVLFFLIYYDSPIEDYNIFIPILKIFLPIGFLYIPFAICVIVGSGNAVNLTDGLDGLLIIPVIFSVLAFYILILFGNIYFSIPIIKETSELSVLCASVIGAGIAFFIFNKHPAKIFMGDVGSLTYGSFLGYLAIVLRLEIFYAIIGLLFVIETLSVIIQVCSYRFFNKRIFKMSPLHHHFEKCGWSELKIVQTFWLFYFICLLIGFLSIVK
jgi:phospho-N-acetylmuramoyl-pentapeptide-transferase